MSQFVPAWPAVRQRLLHYTRLNLQSILFRRVATSRSFPRWQSTQTSRSSATKTASRFDRFITKTPTQFLRTRLTVLKNAPITHIVAFLVLHEITAIVPLFGLASAFHYYEWLPPYFAEGAFVLKGVNMFGNYFRRKGWVTSADSAEARHLAEDGSARQVEKEGNGGVTGWFRRGGTDDQVKGGDNALSRWWNRGEGGTRVIIEFATAYAVVKALLPFRIMISVWGAPWFARWAIVPTRNSFQGLFRRRKMANVVKGVGKGP